MPVSQGGAGCADCDRNGNKFTNGVLDNTFQDYNIHEPGVISETTVDGNGPFMRLANDYFLQQFGPPQDEGSRQNISSRNTKHLRSFWDSVPRWLHHGDAHSLREVLLSPNSPLLGPGERASTSGPCGPTIRGLCRKASGSPSDRSSVYVRRQPRRALGRRERAVGSQPVNLQLAPLIVNGQINPALAANNIQVIKDTHGATSKLTGSDIDAIAKYVMSLEYCRWFESPARKRAGETGRRHLPTVTVSGAWVVPHTRGQSSVVHF